MLVSIMVEFWMIFHYLRKLKIQSFQSQRENDTNLPCATNLYFVWIYRVIMTYLVKNDSENSDVSMINKDNGF